MNILMTDIRCEFCGTLNRPVDSFVYDAEYSYDDYYQTDSVKRCPYSSKFECVDCHKKHHLRVSNS
jgi:hypothetical protein